MTQYQTDFPLPVAFPPERPEPRPGRGARRAPACASCTSPRPRSTPTSRTSSTAATRRRTRARSAILVPSPRDVPTYDHKPEMSAARSTDELVHAAGVRATTASGSSTSPTPTWSATPACIAAAVTAVETVDACLGGSSTPSPRRRRLHRHRRPRQRRAHARAGRRARTPPTSLNPVPFVVTVDGVAAARRRPALRRRADGRSRCSASSSPPR